MDIYRADKPRRLKICLVGSSSVGKTSLATRLVNGTFFFETESTVGGAFASYDLSVNHTNVILQSHRPNLLS
jgi:GTPase SAR1 family protein